MSLKLEKGKIHYVDKNQDEVLDLEYIKAVLFAIYADESEIIDDPKILAEEEFTKYYGWSSKDVLVAQAYFRLINQQRVEKLPWNEAVALSFINRLLDRQRRILSGKEQQLLQRARRGETGYRDDEPILFDKFRRIFNEETLLHKELSGWKYIEDVDRKGFVLDEEGEEDLAPKKRFLFLQNQDGSIEGSLSINEEKIVVIRLDKANGWYRDIQIFPEPTVINDLELEDRELARARTDLFAQAQILDYILDRVLDQGND